MLGKRVVAVVSVSSMLFATATFAASGPSIAVRPIPCVAPAMNARVVATSLTPARAVRAYFTAFPQIPEYYVDMHLATDGSYWGILPQILASTKSFTYRAVTTDAGGKQTSSPLMTATAVPSCRTGLSDADQRYAMNLVLGLISDKQPAVPAGFSCKGIVSVITAGGQLKPNDECRRLLAAAPAGAGTTATTASGAGATGAGAAGAGAAGAGAAAGATAFGLGTLAFGAIAAGAIAAGAIVVHNNNRNNNRPVSPARP